MRDPSDLTPELSRRARGIEVWAALRTLGRAGLADRRAERSRAAALRGGGRPARCRAWMRRQRALRS